MSARSYFMPAVDAYVSFLTVSDILFNPMFRTHPPICRTKYATAFVFCSRFTIWYFAIFWLTHNAFIIPLASFAWKMISPRWFIGIFSWHPMGNLSFHTIWAFNCNFYPFFFIIIIVFFFHILHLTPQPLSAAFGLFFPNGKPQKLWNHIA